LLSSSHSADQVDIRRRNPTPSSSSSDSDRSDIESCFDIEDGHEETDTDTELTGDDTDIDDVKGGVDTGVHDVDGCDEADLAWIAGEDNAYPPEYYLDQENNSDESEDEDEDYEDSTTNLLNMIEDQFYRCVPYSLFVYRLLLVNY